MEMELFRRSGSHQNPKKPTPVGGASGILIKSVHAGMFGLHINCSELQGNSDVQVMVEEGSNIRITQNAFTADELSDKNRTPKIDIQVGDGNTVGHPVFGCIIEDNRIRTGSKSGGPIPEHTVVKVNSNAIGTIIRNWWPYNFIEDDKHKLVEMVEN